MRVWLVILGWALVNCSMAQETIRVGGTGAGTVLVQYLVDSYAKSHPGVTAEVLMPPLGSNGGLRALAAGAVQVAVVSFPFSRQAVPVNVGAGKYIPWVRTPLMFTGRAVADGVQLTIGQVADIYAGKVTRWPDGQPLRLITRTERETDTKILRSLSREMDAAVTLAEKRIGLPFAENDIENQQMLERIPGSFGVIGLGQVLLSNSALNPVRLDGVEPSVVNLRRGSYRFQKPLFLVVSETASPATLEFCRYLQSLKVIESIERYGFIAHAH
ncbi:MAG: substrate-binding domain-containing protein [Rhodocyclales bacterium]|nr:substrate-binding domain-containing protein [Rhodocyclales bacterium]